MFFSRTSHRIAFWYGLSFFVAAILIFVLTGLFLAKLVQTKDREVLQAKLQAYSEIVSREGVKGLHNTNATKKVADHGIFYVRYVDEFGKTRYLHMPDDHEEDSHGQSVEELEAFLLKHENSTWMVFPGRDYGDDIELVSARLEDGSYLQVGKDTEDREEFLEDYLESFLTIFIPTLLVAIAFGLILSNKLLSPLRSLRDTVTGLLHGKTSTRVPVRGNSDELDQLAVIFNRMLDQNALLIRSMTEALDNVAHDLRTPVTRIQINFIHALEKNLDAESLKEVISDGLENLDIVLKIVNTNMDISEAQAGTLRLDKQIVDVAQLLHSAVDLFSHFASEKGFKIESDYPKDVFVFGDYTRLLQAVSNLIDNAIKYSTDKTNIQVGGLVHDRKVEIVVSDMGVGVAPDQADKIWERFYRGDVSRSSRGLGLGLSLVRAIASAHGGTASYEARPGGGSKFKIALPIYHSQ